ncbi:unnamed protein product [Natator depressus]
MGSERDGDGAALSISGGRIVPSGPDTADGISIKDKDTVCCICPQPDGVYSTMRKAKEERRPVTWLQTSPSLPAAVTLTPSSAVPAAASPALSELTHCQAPPAQPQLALSWERSRLAQDRQKYRRVVLEHSRAVRRHRASRRSCPSWSFLGLHSLHHH